jgi:hypothetical protein
MHELKQLTGLTPHHGEDVSIKAKLQSKWGSKLEFGTKFCVLPYIYIYMKTQV